MTNVTNVTFYLKNQEPYEDKVKNSNVSCVVIILRKKLNVFMNKQKNKNVAHYLPLRIMKV